MPSETGCGPDALARLQARAADVDRLVRSHWEELFAGSGLALLAVGGYGRGLLFPHSDIDLLVMAGRDLASPHERERLSELLRRLWDAGLRASHSWRTPQECCTLQSGNFELSVSLLDARLLAGEHALFELFDARWRKFLARNAPQLAAALCRILRSRHARFQSTIYHLEPDVKEGPGGWRDLQTAAWLAQLAGQPPPQGLETLASVIACVRAFLHERHGRDHNTLDFDSQDAAAALGLLGETHPAAWMRAWYRNASAVVRLAARAASFWDHRQRSRLDFLLDRTRALSNADFTVSRGLVWFRNPGHLAVQPELPLRLFLFAGRHGVQPAPDTEVRLEKMARATGGTAQPAGAAFWIELLSLPRAACAVRAMRASAWIGVLLPEWTRIEHLVTPDFSHQFTVDEHTCVALETLEQLHREAAPPGAAFAALWQESAREWWQLRLALLLHDIGKGAGHDHVAGSVRIAGEFLRREGFPARQTGTVLFLIRNHLLLSAAMQSEDLAEPATQERLAERLETVERLRLLVLMTYADTSAVGPGRMTPWRAARLLSLYRTLYARLEGRLELGAPAGGGANWSPEARALIEGLPARYGWSRSSAQIEAEALLLEQARRSGAAVALEFEQGSWRAAVAAADHPCLFAALAGTLSAHGMEIVDCEAFTHRDGYAVDAFRFTDPHRTLELNPPEQERLRDALRRAAIGELSARQLLRRRPIPRLPIRASSEAPAVTILSDVTGRATVVEVAAQDRPALLHDLALCISQFGCDIRLALADTRGHRAVDVFYITRGGMPLDDAAAAELRTRLLAACAWPAPHSR